MLRRYALLTYLSMGVTVWAQIEQLATYAGLELTATCDKTDMTRYHVFSDVFPSASPAAPVFVRVQLSNGLRLCETQVWSHPSNAGQPTFDPVYMPIKFHINQPGAEIIAPPETFSVVRWKAGETSIWMRITTPTSQWFTLNGNPAVPDANNVPQLSFGQSAAQAWGENNTLFPTGVNMRTTARTTNPLTEADSISMLMCLDSSNTDLLPLPSPLSNFDLVSSARTGVPANGANSPVEALDETDILPGAALGVFTGSFDAGSGFLARPALTVFAPPTNPIIDDPGFGETMMQTNFQFFFQTGSWGLDAGTVWQLSIPSSSRAAVPLAMDNGNRIDYNTVDPNIPPGEYFLVDDSTFTASAMATNPPRAPESSIFQSPSGIWYARIVELETNEDNPLVWDNSRAIDFELHAALFSPMVAEPVFNFQYFPRPHSRVRDYPPFDGPNQHFRCPPATLASEIFGAFPLATPRGTPVPTLGEWALIVFAGMLIGTAIWFNRKQRFAASRTN